MNCAVLLASSLLVMVLVLLLTREVRLRRALQQLLVRLLNVWRSGDVEDDACTGTDDDGGPAADGRMRR